MADTIDLADELLILARDASWEGARLSALPRSAHLAIRARDGGVARAATAVGLGSLPAPNEWAAAEGGYVLWTRPDEWLVSVPEASRQVLLEAIARAVGDDDGAVVDLSGGRVVLELSGDASRDVLASCCPLDLDPRVFPVGRCAQSVVGKAPVLLQLAAPTPRWRLYVRPTLADYVVRWLADGMAGARAEWDGGR